jgi:Domain of unknown function (DUF4258)
VVEEGVRGVKNLVFTHHARDRMDERGVTQQEVYSAANEPDHRYPSPKQPGRMIAEKQLETGDILRVIYTEERGLYVIISVIRMSRKRRAGR